MGWEKENKQMKQLLDERQEIYTKQEEMVILNKEQAIEFFKKGDTVLVNNSPACSVEMIENASENSQYEKPQYRLVEVDLSTLISENKLAENCNGEKIIVENQLNFSNGEMEQYEITSQSNFLFNPQADFLSEVIGRCGKIGFSVGYDLTVSDCTISLETDEDLINLNVFFPEEGTAIPVPMTSSEKEEAAQAIEKCLTADHDKESPLPQNLKKTNQEIDR